MADLFNNLLNYLKPHHANAVVNVTDFVKTYIVNDDKENTMRIFKIFDSLNSKNLVEIRLTEGQGTSVTPVNKQGQDFIERNGQTIGRFTINANITNDGLKYLEQADRDKNQDSLTDSVRTTNYWVKRTSIASAVIALFTLLYIIKDFYKTEKEVLTLPLQDQLRKSLQELDSIAKYQKQIEATFRKIAKDSTK